MRVVRDYRVGGPHPFHRPECPRVADPQRRLQIGRYLQGGLPVDAELRTDGLWVWCERAVDDVLHHGIAPEPDFLRHMESLAFRPPLPAPERRLVEDTLIAWRTGPPPPPRLLYTYVVRMDDESTMECPVSLLRRVVDPSGQVTDEALWRDLSWHPTHTFVSHGGEYDLREVTPQHAAAIIDRWCAKWHAERVERSRTAAAAPAPPEEPRQPVRPRQRTGQERTLPLRSR